MKKTIKEDKKAGIVTLTIELSERKSANDPVVNFLTKDARELLSKAGFDVTGCRKSDSANNHKSEDNHRGSWVFSVNKETKPSPRKIQEDAKKDLTSAIEPAIISSKKTDNSVHSQRKGK